MRSFIRYPWKPRPTFEYANLGVLTHVARLAGVVNPAKTTLQEVKILQAPQSPQVPYVSSYTTKGMLHISIAHGSEKREESVREWLDCAVGLLVNI
jgi:hypothetical protein